MDISDILAQLEGFHRDRGGAALSQARTGTRPYELTPPNSDRKEALSPSSSPDTEIRILGKHFQSPARGPRAEEPATLGSCLRTRARSTMAIKRTGHRHADYQAYREFMKPPRVYTYCSQCKGLVPNCPLCGLMKTLGVPPEKPPSAEQMIRENPAYYAKIFGFDEKPKAQTKPVKKRKEVAQPTAPRSASLYPNGERPFWDTPPEKGPEYTSWNPNDTPNQTSLWDQFITPQEPTADAPPAIKPILAAQRPKDKISEPYVRIQRQEQNAGKDVCFSCWSYGHISKHCPESFPRDVRQQEARRVIKGIPLPPTWRLILRNHNMNPMTLEEAEETLRLQSLEKLPNSVTPEKNQNQITDSMTQSLPLSMPARTEPADDMDSSALMLAKTSKVENENPPPNPGSDFERCNVPESGKSSEPSNLGHSSSDISSNSFFKPDNARYKPVGKGVQESKLSPLPPIARIPNEIISNIIRIMLQDEGNTTGQSTPTVYEEESSLQNKNLQLDSIRKINNLWRSLCQAELYRSIPMTSLRTLRQFAECVAKYPDLSVLVREVKIYIPFTTIDGWTPLDIPRAVDEEKYTATTSARCLSLIIAACPNLLRLDASFAGALQSLSFLTKAHSTLTHLSLDDCLPRKSDIRSLGKTVKCFPNLQLLQLETSHGRPVEWKNLTISVGDFVSRRVLLTSIGFKDFPVHDVFLERALPSFPSLKTLQIERCPGVTPKGLARTIMGLENSKLTTLIFVGLQTETGGGKAGSDNSHLCEAIAVKLGSCLVNLTLSSVPVCKKLGSSVTNWSQLQNLVIQGLEFQGCGVDTTEGDVQEAMAVSGIPNLRLDSFIYFGVR